MYEANVKNGLSDDWLPSWLSDFAIAEVLGIPVPEVPKQSARMIYRAGVVLEARRERQAMEEQQGGAKST